MFSLICARTNCWVNNRDDGDLRRHRAHYNLTVMLIETYFGDDYNCRGLCITCVASWSQVAGGNSFHLRKAIADIILHIPGKSACRQDYARRLTMPGIYADFAQFPFIWWGGGGGGGAMKPMIDSSGNSSCINRAGVYLDSVRLNQTGSSPHGGCDKHLSLPRGKMEMWY